MSNKESGNPSRQWSVELGLTQVMRPVLVVTPDKKLTSVKGSDQLTVPSTIESKMAKMKKKIQSPLTKRKGPSSNGNQTSSAGKTFGVSLEEVTKRADGSPIPWILVKIVDYLSLFGLKHEGIFRVSGNHKVVEALKSTFDRDGDADLEECDVMAVAGLLKLFLRELPEPPIPQSLTADFIKVHEVYGDDNPACLDELRALLDKLPYLNHELIKFLCRFLVEVSMNEENNKMSTMALAIVFGPNFFRCKDGLEGLREQGHTNAVTAMFLKEYEQLFKDEGDEISPYATTQLFVHDLSEPESPDRSAHNQRQQIINESSTSDEETLQEKALSADQRRPSEEPIYAAVKKPKKQLQPTSVSSSSEELDVYVRSVSPSHWSSSNGNGNSHTQGTSQAAAQSQRQGSAGRDVVERAINDSVREHLFGPDGISTDDTSSDLSRVQSAESLDQEVAPPLPARQYGDEEVIKQRRKRKKIPRSSREENVEDVEPMALDSQKESNGGAPEKPARSTKKKMKPKPLTFDQNIIITLDKNSNTVIKAVSKPEPSSPTSPSASTNEALDVTEYDHEDEERDHALFRVSRNVDLLLPLTLNRAPPPKNRRRPSLRKNSREEEEEDESTFIGEYEDEIDGDRGSRDKVPKKFVHPLVEEAKARGPVATPPPRSPRAPKVPKSPPSPLSPNKVGRKHASTVDELDHCGYNPVKELTKQYKKHHRGAPMVPPLELYKLQGDIDEHVQRSPRERYDGLGSDEALLSPRSRPLMIDIKSYPTECPPSPPHEQIEHFWYERRVDTSPKGEVTVKQLSKTIHQLKKRVREFEESFEAEHGHKPSPSEKGPIKKEVSELTRCRKQLKELKERAKEESERLNETAPPMSREPEPDEPLLTTTPSSVQQSLNNILRKLQEKRKAAGRPEDVKSMSLEYLQDEKLSVQKALLQHESIFGRPTTKKDKDIMRPLYDRYRMIKRALASSRNESSEGEQSTSTQSSKEDLDALGSQENLFSSTLLKTLDSSALKKDEAESSQKKGRPSDCSTLDGEDEDALSDTVTLLKEHDTRLHRMSQDELVKQVEYAKREKKRLRKKLKKFEDDFFDKTGRRVQRDDRGDMEQDYHDYKQIKARLRLLDALLSKRQASQTL